MGWKVSEEIVPNVMPTREAILRLQAEMARMPQIVLQTNHYFVKGMYARELVIPAGTTLVGKIHKSEHFFMLMSGDMTLWTEEGMRRVQAPYLSCAKPGMKRVGFAHADSVCINIHSTELTDLVEIEEQLIEKEDIPMVDTESRLVECPS